MKYNCLVVAFLCIGAFPTLAYAYTIDEPHYDAGMKFNRVNCENGVWDYIWFDGGVFYIDGSMGDRQTFETQKAAAKYVCREEEKLNPNLE